LLTLAEHLPLKHDFERSIRADAAILRSAIILKTGVKWQYLQLFYARRQPLPATTRK